MEDSFGPSRNASIDLTQPSPPLSSSSQPHLQYQQLHQQQQPAAAAAAAAAAASAAADDRDTNLSVGANNALPSAPVKDVHGRILNPRSCVTCRRRKVKCDKTHPCANCTRQHIECVFPTPGRAPRKTRKSGDPRDAELLARLRRLEGVVKRMGVDPITEEPVPDTVMGQHDPDDAQESEPPLLEEDTRAELECVLDPDAKRRSRKGGPEHRFGRLVVNEGRSRYINSSFWASLSNEVEDLKGILNEDSDEDEDLSPSNISFQTGQRQGWIFSFSSQNVDLLSLHPIPVQLEVYWSIYKENVDPLVKLLHIPSIEPTVLAAASHLANLSKSFEALLFAIYYAVATSLSPDDCITQLGEERSVLLARYKFAVEQALARANFLTTEEIVVLQAFIIFLICLRRNNDARVIWTLTGLIVRIAQTIGIHRDGSHFGLAPFEIEMRRRLWWQVCILDVRASEDHGCDPTITEQTFDTKMPLNVNDVDIDPQMKTFPPERRGCTDMTFSMIRFEVANTFRRINYIPPGNPRACGDFFASVSLEDKERWITECHQKLEDKYLKHCDMTVPIYWVIATVARLMMSKMWLMVYHPFQRQDGGKNLSTETREKLFITSLENIEYSLLLETEARTMKWGWLFRTYMQWHAFAFILVELCHRTRGELVDRAWIAVEKSKDGRWMENTSGSQGSHLWRPLSRLLAKARQARNKTIAEDQAARALSAQQAAASSVGMRSSATPPASSMFRPQFIRAPLSAAQLQRFMSPPVFGTQPIDSTTLMRSPVMEGSILVDEDMDMSTVPMELLGNAAPEAEQQDRPPHTHEILHQQSKAVQINSSNTAFGGFGASSVSKSSPSTNGFNGNANNGVDMRNSSPQQQQQQQQSLPLFGFGSAPAGQHYNMPSIMDGSNDINDNTPVVSPFNSTGDLDWQNWDDLVRQFGMDVEQPNGTSAGAGTNNGSGNGSGQGGNDWSGPSWGHGMGLGGGVIF